MLGPPRCRVTDLAPVQVQQAAAAITVAATLLLSGAPSLHAEVLAPPVESVALDERELIENNKQRIEYELQLQQTVQAALLASQ